MIVQMKKVSLVVLNRERKDALKKLKKVGVMHLETLEGSGEQLAKFKEESSNATNAKMILMDAKLPKKKQVAEKISAEEISEKCKEIIAISEQKKKLTEEIANSTLELGRFKFWGEVDGSDFEYLKENNVSLKMFEVPEAKYSLVSENKEITSLVVNRERKTVRFLLVDAGNKRPASLPPEAFEVPLPSLSTKEIQKKIEDSKARIAEINAEIKKEAVFAPQIEDYKKALETDIQFENIYSGMGKEDEGKETDLAWLSGFVPVDSFKDFEKACAENSWAFASSDPTEEDVVPTKLKNNKLVSLIYPLTDFLGTVPGYFEYDISGWFLLFFTIFFGMIFSDAGYGFIVILLGIVLAIKGKKKGSSATGGLIILLGVATVIWGTITCTWFGLTPEQLPDWLKSLSVPPLSNAYPNETWLPFWQNDVSKGTLTTAQNLQIFCFILAFIQLSIAHIKGIARNISRKSLKCIGELGSLVQLWGMFYVVLDMVVSSSIFSFSEIIYGIPIGKLSIIFVIAGFTLSFIFSNYEGSVIKSILESMKNIISVLLGVVNVFSDIVSYIRLWAVALAGAAISNTVNTMAGPLLGHAILFVVAILLLVFGHGLNMILNLLSVIVHGVRLNTLEFSNHLGMSWSGFKYSPFSEKDNK